MTGMQVSELYKQAVALLESAACDSPEFDVTCLLEDIGGLGRGKVPFCMPRELDKPTCDRVLVAVHKRANGEPLQYLLGTWDFLSLTLAVGEGVLIPRPETELLCQTVADWLFNCYHGTHATVWDLCAGTGCVGLGIASLYPNCDVTEYEVSPEAAVYLQKNIAAHPQFSATAVYANILTDFDRFSGPVDVIVSNPPYIPKADLASLQREVQYEPRLALDGGDGYTFYRAIAKHWIPKLNNGGFASVEIGIGQGDTVCELFRAAGLNNVQCIKDFAGIDRVVFGQKPV